jgi:uncharacterized protein YegJ (DUF2314 family)
VRLRAALLLAMCGGLSLATPGCSRAEPPVIWTDKHDGRMNQAIRDAKDSLPQFWARLDAGDPDLEDPMVKVGYPTAHGGTEYLWMDVRSHDDSTVAGKLENEPEDVPGVHAGQDVSVERGRLVDWGYYKRDKSFGQFTTRALIVTADKKTRDAIGAESLAPTPIEPELH